MSMTINDFDKLLTKAKNAIYENEDPRTALIFIHKILDLVETAAFCARKRASSAEARTALAKIDHEAQEQASQVLGFVQELIREEYRCK